MEKNADHVLKRMPAHIAETFTEEQKAHLHAALGVRSWKKHSIDIRTHFPVPFFKQRLYLVLLMGVNRRSLSRQEQQISKYTLLVLFTTYLIISALFGLLVLYLIKSALGINLFDNFSLGIWGWFKARFLG